MRFNITSILLSSLCVAALTACTHEDASVLSPDTERAELHFSAMVEQSSRAATMAMKQTFDDGDSIGITVTGINPDSGYTYNNVRVMTIGDYPSQHWRIDTTIVLTKARMQLCAFSPYQKGADPTRMPLVCNDQTDYLYAPYGAWTKKGTLNYADPFVNVRMDHLQTMILIRVVNEDNTGDAPKLTAFSVTGQGFSKKGDFDNTDGTFYINSMDINDSIHHDVQPWALPMDVKDTVSIDSAYVFSTTEKKPLTFTLTVDGKRLSATKEVQLEHGYVYIFPLCVKGKKKLVIDKVDIKKWDELDWIFGLYPNYLTEHPLFFED